MAWLHSAWNQVLDLGSRLQVSCNTRHGYEAVTLGLRRFPDLVAVATCAVRTRGICAYLQRTIGSKGLTLRARPSRACRPAESACRAAKE
jgi:hypothetical protein